MAPHPPDLLAALETVVEGVVEGVEDVVDVDLEEVVVEAPRLLRLESSTGLVSPLRWRRSRQVGLERRP